MKVKVLVSGLLFAVLFFASLSYSGVPQMINYQGKLTTPAGALMDTTIQMVFTIYDAATDGGVLWTETQPSVAVEKGIFSVLLGSVTPIPDPVFAGPTRYLGVKVGGDPEMTPRKAITSVGYAYNADKLDGYHAGHFPMKNTSTIGPGFPDTTIIPIPHGMFILTICEHHASPNSNAVGFVHGVENDYWIAWHGFDGDGNQVRGNASLNSTTTILTVRGGGIWVETPGQYERQLLLITSSEHASYYIITDKMW